jgi:cell division protein FtsW (lipid II flippase)
MKQESQFTTLLLIAFIVLKLCKVIDWSWWWVLSPAWIPLALAIFFFPFYVISQNRKRKNLIKKSASKFQERFNQYQKEHQQRQSSKFN